jgi:hypothetical protein
VSAETPARSLLLNPAKPSASTKGGTMTRLALLFVATVTLLPLPVAGHHQGAPLADHTLARFHRAIHAYLDVHRRAERSLPPLRPTSDWMEITRAIEARAAAIRSARPTAAEGDLFDPETSEVIRGRIRAVLRQRGDGLAGLLENTDEESTSGAMRPVVNGRFPWARGAMMPPDILHVLPPLPEELQYRLVDRDLVLIDMHADLVVDILPGALPDRTSDTWR